MGVNFIQANPALEAFNKTMKANADARAADIKLQQETLGLLEGTATAPHRIRRISADADTARANADVAKEVVPFEIQIRKNTAERGGIETDGARLGLSERQQTSAPRVEADIATSRATTTTAPVEAGVKVATAPYRVQSARDDATIGGVKAQDAQLAFIKESIALIEAGRVEEAKELARRRGEDLPDVVINNSAMRGQITAAIAAAENLYPGRPRAQAEHVKRIQADLAKSPDAAAKAGPGAAYNVPGMETPPETSLKGQPPTAQAQNLDDLLRRGLAKTQQEAWDLYTQSKSDPQASLRRLYESELKIRIDAAKGPGGMGVPPTGEALKKLQNEAIFAAGQTNQTLRNMAMPKQATPPAPVAATGAPPPAASPAPLPAAPVAPAAPAEPQQQGWFRRPIMGGPAAPAPQVAPPSAAPAKEQGRLPVSSAPLAPEIQQRAQGMQPEEIRRQAAAAIASGKDRDAVIARLTQLGVSTAGL